MQKNRTSELTLSGEQTYIDDGACRFSQYRRDIKEIPSVHTTNFLLQFLSYQNCSSINIPRNHKTSPRRLHANSASLTRTDYTEITQQNVKMDLWKRKCEFLEKGTSTNVPIVRPKTDSVTP